VLDRALADPEWVAERLGRLRQYGPTRAKEWAAAAFDRESLEVAWTAVTDAKSALELERQVLIELADADLWTRARSRRSLGRASRSRFTSEAGRVSNVRVATTEFGWPAWPASGGVQRPRAGRLFAAERDTAASARYSRLIVTSHTAAAWPGCCRGARWDALYRGCPTLWVVAHFRTAVPPSTVVRSWPTRGLPSSK
jgi:hypothetical protein